MKKMFIAAAGCLLFFTCTVNEKKAENGKSDADSKATVSATDKKPATEILDLSMADPLKKSHTAFARGDVDAMTADFADNVRYTWSGGDSLIGKQAVKDYFSGRLKLIKSIKYSNEIVLPLQVNVSQQPQAAPPGKWVLYWAMADVTYKNDKNIKFWMHNVNHFNEAGKIDLVGQYMDRHPIMEATKGLVK